MAENLAKLLLSLTNRCGLLTGADATSVFLRGLNVGAASARLAPFATAADRGGTADDGDSDGLEDCDIEVEGSAGGAASEPQSESLDATFNSSTPESSVASRVLELEEGAPSRPPGQGRPPYRAWTPDT